MFHLEWAVDCKLGSEKPCPGWNGLTQLFWCAIHCHTKKVVM